jgi:hypothetical protein
METFEFLKLNFVLGAIVILGGFVYLVVLINKRRKNKFLHPEPRKPRKKNPEQPPDDR